MFINLKKSKKKRLKKYELKKLRLLYFIVFSSLTVVSVMFLDNSFKRLPALGRFFSPQHGMWQNVEKVEQEKEVILKIRDRIMENCEIKYDERNVPHVFSESELDAYFIEGYLHAKNRMFQMDFYSRIACGRVSEFLGNKGVSLDRFMIRVGLKHAAAKMLIEVQKDPLTKKICDAYTKGVNEYINSIKYAKYPLEYKMYSFKPELWSNFKTVLIIKLMEFDKSGFSEDFKKNFIARNFGEEVYNLIYPNISTIDVPVFNSGMDFQIPHKARTHSSNVHHKLKQNNFFFSSCEAPIFKEPYNYKMEIGSTTWAVSGKKSESNRSMLCYSHSSLFSLPNYFYEIQISCPTHNAYGISYPGIPCIYVGFNKKIAWGFNVPNIDVKDYYEIEFSDGSKNFFLFNEKWCKTYIYEEKIKVKYRLSIKEKYIETPIGVLIFDTIINGKHKGYVMRWTGHEKSNELKSFYLINKAKNYNEFINAIRFINCPVSNVVYADDQGNIGLNLKGKIPVKSNYQGDFIMNGNDSNALWNNFISDMEKPFLYNPSDNFVFSSNQFLFYPDIYPYYLGSMFNGVSSKRIYEYMSSKNKLSVNDMFNLLSENYSSFAETLVPLLLDYIETDLINSKELKFIKILQNWNYRYDMEEESPTIFELWVENLQKLIIKKNIRKFRNLKDFLMPPIALIQMLQNTDIKNYLIDTSSATIGETWKQLIFESFQMTVPKLSKLSKAKKLEWAYNRYNTLKHILSVNSLSIKKINVYGGNDKIYTNINTNYGSNIKFVVHHTYPIEAFVSSAGGQSGNVGSPYYNYSVDKWLNGEYEKIVYLESPTSTAKKIVQNVKVVNYVGKRFSDYFNL